MPKLRWTNRFHYRTFVDTNLGVLTMVSSNLGEPVVGETVGGALLMVFKPDGYFSDLEMQLNPDRQALGPLLPETASPVDDVDVLVGAESDVVWARAGDVVRVDFDDGNADLWLRLRSEPVWFGVSDAGWLKSLVMRDIIDDPGGMREAGWLDEIGAES